MDGSMFNNLPVGNLLCFIVAVLGGVGGFAWLIWLAVEHLRII